jgi:hypothetical protein
MYLAQMSASLSPFLVILNVRVDYKNGAQN